MKPNLQESEIQPNNGSASRRRNDRAFTLIELLVVIAIIAVIAAMLLPALSMAKSRAQMAQDLNNVHQIMMAAHMYATDNNGYLPEPGENTVTPSAFFGVPFLIPNPTQGVNPGGTRATYDQYYPLQVRSFKSLKSDGTPLTDRAKFCQFTPYLKNEKVLRCPADVPNILMYQRQVYLTSYCWNQAVIGNGFDGGCRTPSWTLNGVSTCSTLKVSQFKADDILLFENDELNVGIWGQWNDSVSWPSCGISARHGKSGVVGNADGSASTITLCAWYMMVANQCAKYTGGGTGCALLGQRIPNRLWCNPIAGNGV